jgi:hypothetical protein
VREELKRSGGYVTADVIDVSPETPNLEVMLAKFNREHWHDEDEVRFIIHGPGYSTLTPYISRYFDTTTGTTGSKTDSHSYQEIAKILQRLPSEMVFILDGHPRA